MSTSETTDRKGKFFKAIVATPPDLKKPKKSTPRTLSTLQPRQCHPVVPPSSTPKTTSGPTGEAIALGTSSREDEPPTILRRLDGTSGVKFGDADRCGDSVMNLNKLLFTRNVTGCRGRGEKLEDTAIIQSIFDANHGSELDVAHHETDFPTQLMASQPGPVSSAKSDPTQLEQSTAGLLSRAYSPLSVRGKRGVLRLAKSDAKEEVVGRGAKKAGDRRNLGGRQRTVRLPKLSGQSRETRKTVGCGREDVNSSDMMPNGTTKLKRSRCEQVSKSTASADTTSVSYPCPRNLTVIQRRGRRTTTRVCSPMPLPRKPLPPIRRRHHSDICTVCPEVHDWKGLARNPRWYPAKTTRQCSCERRKSAVAEPYTDSDEVYEMEVTLKLKETAEFQGVHYESKNEEMKKGENKIDKEEGSNWFPERSIPVQQNQDQVVKEEGKTKDIICMESNGGCDAVRNAHCPWLSRGSSLDDTQDSTKGIGLNNRMPSNNDDTLNTRTMLDGMDFECDNQTECAFEEDNTFLQAVLLRNHVLNHGVMADPSDPGLPSEAEGQDSLDNVIQDIGTRTRKRFEDRNMLLNYCTRLLQVQGPCESAKVMHPLTATQQGSHMSLSPKADVVMTSRGQQKVVNSSLVAVGRGQNGNKVNNGKEASRSSNSEVRRDYSSETLLKQEMNRYLHSLRHENSKEKHHHGLSSAQNIPMKVQNLTAIRPITADASNNSALTNQVTKAVGFIPILTREEYDSICKKTSGPSSRFQRAPALPPIVGNPSEMLLIKRFDGEVKGMQLPQRRESKTKK